MSMAGGNADAEGARPDIPWVLDIDTDGLVQRGMRLLDREANPCDERFDLESVRRGLVLGISSALFEVKGRMEIDSSRKEQKDGNSSENQ